MFGDSRPTYYSCQAKSREKKKEKEANTIKGLGADHGKAPKKSQHQLKSKASAGYGMNKKDKESF